MFLTFKKWSALYLLSLVLLFVAFVMIWQQGRAVQTSANTALEQVRGEMVLIIDPGHGGEDGGAVASDGTVESNINLSIALKVEEIAKFLGWETVMTRREDISIHDAGSETLRQKKVSDLRNRVELCNSTSGGILVSIHQNSLPQAPSVHGAQVFYNGQPGSEELAKAIQDSLNAAVNTENAKTAKTINSGVYLMENVTCPAVLVECGFLSNVGETRLLKDEAYQRKLASVILSAATGHLAQSEENAGQNRTNVVY